MLPPVVLTSAVSGKISTQYFGDNFDADKVDGNIDIILRVDVPRIVWGNNDTTLMFDINKRTITGVSGNDKIYDGATGY